MRPEQKAAYDLEPTDGWRLTVQYDDWRTESDRDYEDRAKSYADIAKASRRLVFDGYVAVRLPKHWRASNGYVREHIAIAEVALGKPLPPTAKVHHVNGERADNRRSNLVICDGEKYHQLLHRRMRIKARGGNPNTDRICSTCKAVKACSEFYGPSYSYECKACILKMQAKLWVLKKAQREQVVGS